MLNEEMYFKDWEEATKYMNEHPDPTQEEVILDMKVVYSSVIVAMVSDTSVLGRMVLEELTGLKLETNDQLYDYLAKTITLDREKALKFGLATLAESGGMDEIMDVLSEVGIR
jgi:hypothetical protein